MTWLAVNKDGSEVCSNNKLFKHHEVTTELIEAFGKEYEHFFKEEDQWCDSFSNEYYYTVPKFRGVVLPKGTINKLIGRELTWNDEPVEI